MSKHTPTPAEALRDILAYAQDEFGNVDPDSASQMIGVMQDGTLTLKGSFIATLERARAALPQAKAQEAEIAALVEALEELTNWQYAVEGVAPELGGLLRSMYKAKGFLAKHKART